MIESEFTEAFWRSLAFEDIQVHIGRTKRFGAWSADVSIGPIYLGTLVAKKKSRLLDKLAEELSAIEGKINANAGLPTSEGL